MSPGRWPHWAPFGVVCAGTLYGAACPPHDWSFAAWAVPGLLLLSTERCRPLPAALCGALFAIVYGAGMTAWALHASLEYFDFNRLVAGGFVVLVWLVYGGVPFALLLAAWPAAARRVPHAGRGLLAAWLWAACEVLRATLFTGMPWELLGHTQFHHLALIQVADLGGVYAVSFVMALVSVSVGDVLCALGRGDRTSGPALRRLAFAGAVLAAVLAYGAQRRAVYGAPTDGPARTVTVVQGNVPNAFRWKRAYFARALATYAALTTRAAAPMPDLIVWPENAVNFYIDREPLLYADLRKVAALAREGLLVGGPRLDGDGTAHNSAYLLASDGRIAATYDKQRLVPLAEYNPLPSVAGSAAAEPVAYGPGPASDPLQAPTLRLGTVICYEALFPHLVGDLVRRGADLLVNISNDSWLDSGDGGAPRQHFSMVVFRAVETRRYLVRASASGVSGFIGPDGHTYGLLARGTAGATMGTIVPLHGTTPYVRWGEAWILLGGLLCGATLRRRPEAAP